MNTTKLERAVYVVFILEAVLLTSWLSFNIHAAIVSYAVAQWFYVGMWALCAFFAITTGVKFPGPPKKSSLLSTMVLVWFVLQVIALVYGQAWFALFPLLISRAAAYLLPKYIEA